MQIDILYEISIILLLISNFLFPVSLKNRNLILTIFIFISLGIYILFGEYIHLSDANIYCERFDYYSNFSLLDIYKNAEKSPTYYALGNIFAKIIPNAEAWAHFIIFYIYM